MKLYIDTREHEAPLQRIIPAFESIGVEYERRKLDVGDYMNPENPLVSVDRKMHLGELCTNLCSPDKGRFWREIRRAKESGVKLIVLCEHGGKIKSIKDVSSWTSKYSRVSGRDLMEKIYQAHISYGVEFLFCDKRSTAKRIVELLGGDGVG